MPQLDVNAWPPQLFWLAVTFLVLYFIISKVVIPRTGGVIEGRQKQIDSDLASALRFRRVPGSGPARRVLRTSLLYLPGLLALLLLDHLVALLFLAN